MISKADSAFDTASIRQWRHGRVQAQLAQRDIGAIVLFDPINIRYTTGSRNMQVWTMHNVCRYALVVTDGPTILFDLPSSSHLSDELELIDEVRPSLAVDYMMVGERGDEMATRWAAEIADVVATHCDGNRRIAVDRADTLYLNAINALDFEITDGKNVMQHARSIKSNEEVGALKRSLATAEVAVTKMRESIQPGMRESQALAILIGESIALGGEYPETRLLTSGPRTNPWFQETSDRVMEQGELLAFDTDLIGPGGFYNDISRSWTIGETTPTDQQRRLYTLAHEQLEHNMRLLKPGISFLEYSDQAYQLPTQCIPNRYADVAHGCGMDVEYPLIWYREDEQWGAYDGMFEENMVVCLECYVGEAGGSEGVKLEQPVWIRADGPQLLSDYPLETDWL